MRNVEEIINRKKISDLSAFLKGRSLPIIHEKATIEEVVGAMVRFERSRLLYVVDDEGKLVGTISLGLLARHIFSPGHEPQIHARFLLSIITAEFAKDIMQKNLVVAAKEEEVGAVLQRMIRANVKEIPVVDSEKRVIADLTIVDLLRFIVSSVQEE